MEERVLHTNRIKLHLLRYDGGSPPLMLLPGLTANAHCFGGLAAGLSPQYELLAVDLRGRGLSDKPSLSRLSRVLPSWDDYRQEMKQMPFYDGWWDPLLEAFYRADIEVFADGSVQARSRPEAMIAAIEGVLAEPWPDYLTVIGQPALVLNATGSYGPPGAPPLILAQDAQETAAGLLHGRYVPNAGNHMTMLFGTGAWETAAAIRAFLD